MNWRETTLNEIVRWTEGLCALFGVQGVCNVVRGYPPVWNNPESTAFALEVSRNNIGAEQPLPFEPKMWGEDFGYYGGHIPATFWMLGVRQPELESVPGLHNPQFIPDEDALPLGAAMLASSAIEWLKR